MRNSKTGKESVKLRQLDRHPVLLKLSLDKLIQFLFLGTLFFLVIFCWKSIQGFRFNSLASPLSLALAAYCSALILRFKIQVTQQTIVLYLMWAAWIVYVDAISGDFLAAFARDTHWLILPIFITLIAELVRLQPITPRIFRLSAAFSIVLILIYYLENAEWVFEWKYAPVFGNIRHFSLTMGVFTVLLYDRSETGKYEKVFLKVVRVIGLAMLFWSGSRGPILAWLLSLFLYLKIWPNSNYFKGTIIEISAALALAIIFDVGNASMGVWNAFFRSAQSESLDALSSSRIQIWKSTIDALVSRHLLLTGAGGNGFIRMHLPLDGQMAQPHNVAIQILSDWGLVGLFLSVLFGAGTILKALISPPLSSHGAVARAVVLYIFVSSLFDAAMYHLEHLIYLSIALGVILSEQQENKSGARFGCVFLLLFGLFSTLHLSLLDYRVSIAPQKPIKAPLIHAR